MSASNDPAKANADQAHYWESVAAPKWIDLAEPLDAVFAPVNALLLARASPKPGEQVLDVGCGTGATARALAESVGAEGHVVAADISAPLLAHAKARTPASLASRLSFIELDAQTHGFTSGHFDLLVSRFGVMFFEAPIAAFANLRRALRPGGRLHVAAWGPIEVNPWFGISRDAAIARLGHPPPVPPTAPGPLAFADIAYVLEILREAGFATAAAEVVSLDLEPPGGVDGAVLLMSSIGPAARILAHFEGSPDDARAIREATSVALAPYRVEDRIRIPAVLNLFAAVAP
jgi:SAM-dependent methyltransferase